MAPTTFSDFFPRLPPELRVRIWTIHCNSDKRLVELQFSKQLQGDGQLAYQWTSKNRIPSALEVCRESRHEGLKIYKLSFPHERKHPSFQKIPATIYFNPVVDTIYLNNETMKTLKYCTRNERRQEVGLAEDLGTPGFDYDLFSGYDITYDGDDDYENLDFVKIGARLPKGMKEVTSLAMEAVMFQEYHEDVLGIKTYWENNFTSGIFSLLSFKNTFANLEKFFFVHEMDNIGDPSFISRGLKSELRVEFRETWEEEENKEEDKEMPIPLVRSVERHKQKGVNILGGIPFELHL